MRTVAFQPNGEILIGGDFTSVGGQIRNRLARLNVDGSLDAGFAPTLPDSTRATSIAVQPDGKVLAAGTLFASLDGAQTFYELMRLNSNGTLDTSFIPIINGRVYSVAVQSDGKILIGGAFTRVGEEDRKRVARLNPDGTLDESFVDSNVVGGGVNSVTPGPDGKILIGGEFTSVGSSPTTMRGVARLKNDGTLDTSFEDPQVTGGNVVQSVAAQPDGKVLIGGGFEFVADEPRKFIGRLNTNGTLDTGFTTEVLNSAVDAVLLQDDGSILIGGVFSQVGDENRSQLARLNANGNLDTTFVNPAIGDTAVNALALQPDGKVVTGGSSAGNGRVRRVFSTTPQAAPTSVSATADNGQATVSWTAVPGEITGYSVTASPGGATCGATSSTSCTVTGLTNGTSYTFTVRAANGFGSGPASSPSNAVTPAAPAPDPPGPTPDPPGPTPDPPAPDPTVTVEQLRAKVTGKSVLVTSRVKASGAGRIAQRATTGKGKKTRTWCRASKTVSAAGTHSLQCNLGSKGRKALRKGALSLTLRTSFTPTAGDAVTANRKLTVKRKR